MRKLFIAILCLSISMMAKAQNFNRSVSFNYLIEADTVLYPFDGNPATSIGISGQVTFTSELGFVRFVVSDNYDDEYMIYESYRLFENDSTFSFSQKCEESCFFESYTPTELIVQVYDAIVNINSIETSNTTYSNPEFLRLTAAAAANNQKLTKIQNYIQNKGLIWIANSTKMSSMSYKQKAKIFGDGFRTYGYEFFSKGFFSVFGPDRYSSSKNYVSNFDWRNRHGANNPQSSYYDGDPLGTGWITPVVCQSEGCWLNDSFECDIDAEECERLGGDYRGASTCWIFGPTAQVEALTNLYYNQHLDVDLSEQFIACREGTVEANQPRKAIKHYKQEGVPLESCLPYSASLENCEDFCADSLIRVRITDYIEHGQQSMTDSLLKQYIINKGPLTASSLPLGYGLNNHCMALVGWGTIDEDVVENILGLPYENGYYDKDFLGLTYWIYKESMGSDENNSDYGFKYILHINNDAPENTYSISTPIHYNNLTEQDVRCVDTDGDGYYNWGIGPKPAHCPPCPDEPDGDDSNPNLGPLNSFGQCTIIGTYNASFENGWDNWMQVEVPNRDNGIFWRHSTPPPSNSTGPSYAQDGDYYIYIDTREMSSYAQKYSCIESPDINLHGSCNNILDFYYNMNIYDWNSGEDQPRIVLSTQNNNNTWKFNHPYWSEKGNHGPDWQHASILLPSDVKKVRLYVETGKYHFSDIAIDNITIGPWNYDNTPIVINDNTLWDENMIVNQDIIVENGGCLTIRKTSGTNLKIKLHSDAKIIVKPGGKLILEHCTLTNACPNELWQGIEIWGNKNANQFVDTNGQYTQGYVELRNGATIENAICALELWRPGYWSTTGGIVYAEDAVFRNNQRSVHALYYKNYHANGKETNYNASFTRCRFDVNWNYQGDEDHIFHKHVDLDHVRGISFQSCDFSVTEPSDNISYWTSGIAGYEAGFNVSGQCKNNNIYPCPSYDNSTFSGFQSAISALNDGTRTPPTISVTHSSFSKNDFGIYVNNLSNVSVRFCDFDVKRQDNWLCGAGIFLENAYNYSIEENALTKTNTYNGDGIGIIIKDCAVQSKIYRNSFENLHCGNLAWGRNILMKSSNNYIGLEYGCNTNTGNAIDFYVLGEDGVFSGIQSSQGSSLAAARNTFSANGYHFYNNGDHRITYYYYDATGFGDEQPLNNSEGNVRVESTTQTDNCPSNFGENPVSLVLTAAEKQQREQEYYDAYAAYNSLKSVYDSHIDGGSTSDMLDDIATATPTDMWVLRAQLLGASPYLSSPVLTAVSDRDDVFTESVLFEILLSNPEELKKDSLMDFLRNKTNPLPEYMMNILDQVANGATARTVMEARMAASRGEYTRAAGDIIRGLVNDTIINLIELRGWLGNLDDIHADHDIIATYVDEGNFTDALALANMLPTLYGLTGNDLTEHNDYVELLELYRDLYNDDRNTMQLDSTERVQVERIAHYGTGYPQSMAQAILYGTDWESYTDENPFNCPDLTIVEDAKGGDRIYTYTQEDLSKAMGMSVSVKPNPATTWTAVDYNLPKDDTKATVTITSALGVTMLSSELNGHQGQKVLDLRHLSDGVYVYTVRCGEFVQTGKLVVTK